MLTFCFEVKQVVLGVDSSAFVDEWESQNSDRCLMFILEMKRRSKLAFFNNLWVFFCEIFEKVLPPISVNIRACEVYIGEVIFSKFTKSDNKIWPLQSDFASILCFLNLPKLLLKSFQDSWSFLRLNFIYLLDWCWAWVKIVFLSNLRAPFGGINSSWSF